MGGINDIFIKGGYKGHKTYFSCVGGVFGSKSIFLVQKCIFIWGGVLRVKNVFL